MKRTVEEIRQEMKNRGTDVTSTQDVILGGIMFAIEDLGEELKKEE